MTLSLYSFRPHALKDAPHGPARALGDLAATCIVRDRSYRAALTELDQLGAALRSRPVVDQACGMVMHVLGCDADAAFAVLRRISQGTNRKLSDVASAVVEKRGGAWRGNWSPFPTEPSRGALKRPGPCPCAAPPRGDDQSAGSPCGPRRTGSPQRTAPRPAHRTRRPDPHNSGAHGPASAPSLRPLAWCPAARAPPGSAL